MFIVYDKDMNIKDFPRGVRPLDIFVHAMERRRETEAVKGRSGVITKGITSLNRPIEIEVGLMAHDTMDYRLLKSELYSFFGDDEFYISETHERGKRYKVTLLQSYIPERLNQKVARASFVLDMVNLPFAESIGTTNDIEEKGILDSDELWGFGMGLIADDESLKYTHTTKQFRIYNAGNVPIHPFEQYLKITLDEIEGSFSYLELRNETTGRKFRITTGADGTIVIDGPTVTKNGFFNYLRSTNMNFIELVPGWNEFEIIGATSVRTAFDFRFYYK